MLQCKLEAIDPWTVILRGIYRNQLRPERDGNIPGGTGFCLGLTGSGNYLRRVLGEAPQGGDTDTAGAITGALAGATVGENAIEAEWIENIMEWPRSVSVLRKVADALAAGDNSPSGSIKYFWPGVTVRNLFMLAIVFGHVFLRLIPTRIRRFIRI